MQGLTTARLFGRLPNNDYVLLPLLSLLTICVTLLGLEFAARWCWPEIAVDSCEFHDDSKGFQFRPNCQSYVKNFEGPLVSNQYNECGFRTAEPCSSKLPNQLRVAVIGTSVSRGYLVPYTDNLGAECVRDFATRSEAHDFRQATLIAHAHTQRHSSDLDRLPPGTAHQ